jgi:hypothetical protein
MPNTCLCHADPEDEPILRISKINVEVQNIILSVRKGHDTTNSKYSLKFQTSDNNIQI